MNSLALVQHEISSTLACIDDAAMIALREALADRNRRWFVSGQGRSRLVGSMIAMRLMHIGFSVHLTGEVTAPAIVAGDGLLMLSASGETPVSLHLASRAVAAGAHLLAITTRADSALATMADTVVIVPVDTSRQFGGSLFEQAALVLLDSVVMDIIGDDPAAHDVMHSRHTNLE